MTPLDVAAVPALVWAFASANAQAGTFGKELSDALKLPDFMALK